MQVLVVLLTLEVTNTKKIIFCGAKCDIRQAKGEDELSLIVFQ